MCCFLLKYNPNKVICKWPLWKYLKNLEDSNLEFYKHNFANFLQEKWILTIGIVFFKTKQILARYKSEKCTKTIIEQKYALFAWQVIYYLRLQLQRHCQKNCIKPQKEYAVNPDLADFELDHLELPCGPSICPFKAIIGQDSLH